jgi:hypothetical protein
MFVLVSGDFPFEGTSTFREFSKRRNVKSGTRQQATGASGCLLNLYSKDGNDYRRA